MSDLSLPSWTDKVHQLALSLQPQQTAKPRWHELPPAQADAPLLLSLILETSLPQERPGAWPPLILHLHALLGHRWELLIPGPAPIWLDELRAGLGGALRCFPERQGQSLQEQAKVLAGGHWMLPVNLNTALAPTLVETLEAYSCWSATRLLLGPDSVYVQHRQALWQPSTSHSQCLWISTPLILNPGRNLLPATTDREQHAQGTEVPDSDWPVHVLIDASDQPQRLLIQPELLTQIGATPDSDPLILLSRAEALGIPARVAIDSKQSAQSREGLSIQPLLRPYHWLPRIHSERADHALILPQNKGEAIPVQAQHWQLAGFTVLQSAEPNPIQHWPNLRWLTWLSNDCLIAAKELDQLRHPKNATLPQMRDRGSGRELLDPPNAEHPVGLTMPLKAERQPGVAIKPPPRSDWKRLAQVTLALDDRCKKSILLRARDRMMRILHRST